MKSLSPLRTFSPCHQPKSATPRPPEVEMHSPDSRSDGWSGSGTALVLGMACAGGALAAPTAQVQMSRTESVKALKELNFLEHVAHEHGGSLRSQSTNPLGQLLNYQPEVEPVEALDHLNQGYSLYYYAGPESTPSPIRSSRELRELTGQVRQQEFKDKIDQGDYQGAARVFSDGLGDLIP